jgi:diaminopimelate epimerase
MAERHFGAGSDGIILVQPGDNAPFRMRIFNADGSEGDMCGNGIRCFARFVYDHGITRDTDFAIETRHGLIHAVLNVWDDGVQSISVYMGIPVLTRKDIPVSKLDGPEPATGEVAVVDGIPYLGTALSTGNPHFVVFVDDSGRSIWSMWGRSRRLIHCSLIRRISILPTVRQVGNRLRVGERFGITLACGTGASAELVAAVA